MKLLKKTVFVLVGTMVFQCSVPVMGQEISDAELDMPIQLEDSVIQGKEDSILADEESGQQKNEQLVEDVESQTVVVQEERKDTILYEEKESDRIEKDTVHGYGWSYNPAEGWYFYDAAGIKVTGWLNSGGKWYYLDPNNVEYPGLMVSDCIREIGGDVYGFNRDGSMAVGWYYRESEGWYYHDQSGARKTGWVRSYGLWYYLDSENGNKMVCDTWKLIGGKWYYFEKNGVMKTNWAYICGEWYYFGADGGARIGWQMINGDWYYFYTAHDVHGGPEASMAANQSIDGWYIGFDGIARPDERIADIMTYTYVPYVSGGTTPVGWDCSGFTQWALGYLGVNIPRLSHEQAMGGTWVDPWNMASWRPGDILVYSTNGYAGHVALYLGDGMLMHSLNEKYGTIIQSVAYYDWWDTGTYLSGVRRYL